MSSRRFIDGIQQEIGSLPLEATQTTISANLSCASSLDGTAIASSVANLTVSSDATYEANLIISAATTYTTASSTSGTSQLDNSGTSNISTNIAISASGQLNVNGTSNISTTEEIVANGSVTINGVLQNLENITTLTATAFILPPSNCVGPYALGTGDYCGCSCNCCPPCPCYTSWTYTYACGSPASNWYYGCTCINAPVLPFAPQSEITDFPDFPDFNEKEFVFSLDVQEEEPCIDCPPNPPYCSIPCVTYTITITTSGCCLYGNGTSFTAVGAGQICVSDPPATVCDGNSFTVTINGSTNNCVAVNDGDSVTISITPPSSLCCECCSISSEGTLLPDCQVQALKKALILNRRSTSGANKLYINKKKLLERAAKLRR